MSEWWEITLVICGAIITVLTVWNMVESRVKSIKEPTQTLSSRVAVIESKIEEYEQRFKRDKERIEEIERGNRITQRSLLALLNHDLIGDNVEEMTDVKKELENYLINLGINTL